MCFAAMARDPSAGQRIGPSPDRQHGRIGAVTPHLPDVRGPRATAADGAVRQAHAGAADAGRREALGCARRVCT